MKPKDKAIYSWRNYLWVICCVAISAYFVTAQKPPQPFNFPHPVVKNEGDGNKINIHSVLRIAGATRRTVIEIEVYSDVPFSGGNDTHVLHIGSKRFTWPRGGDATGNTLIFELTPEQFSKVKSGDEVKVTYGLDDESSDRTAVPQRIWKFGKFDKSKIDE